MRTILLVPLSISIVGLISLYSILVLCFLPKRGSRTMYNRCRASGSTSTLDVAELMGLRGKLTARSRNGVDGLSCHRLSWSFQGEDSIPTGPYEIRLISSDGEQLRILCEPLPSSTD